MFTMISKEKIGVKLERKKVKIKCVETFFLKGELFCKFANI